MSEENKRRKFSIPKEAWSFIVPGANRPAQKTWGIKAQAVNAASFHDSYESGSDELPRENDLIALGYRIVKVLVVVEPEQ